MEVTDLLEAYNSTNDDDIKYMLLKKEKKISNKEDLYKFIWELSLPILQRSIQGTTSSQILGDLLSQEVLPFTIGAYFQDMRIHEVVEESKPIISLICESCKNYCTESDIFLQALRNILQNFIERDILFVYDECFDDSTNIVTYFCSISSSGPLYTECLTLLLKLCYNGQEKSIPAVLLDSILSVADKGSNTVITNDLLKTMCKLTTSWELDVVTERISLSAFLTISCYWYKFTPSVTHLFVNFLIPMLASEMNTLEVLKIIQNLSPFFQIRSVSTGKVYLDTELVEKLKSSVKQLLASTNDTIGFYESGLRGRNGNLKIENDPIDSDQKNYISQLDFSDDEDEIEFENENMVSSNIPSNEILKLREIQQLLLDVEDKINAVDVAVVVGHDHDEAMVDVLDLKEISVGLNNFPSKAILLATLFHKLRIGKDEIELSTLQTSLNVTEQLIKNKEQINLTMEEQSKLCELILPYLQKNKRFVNILKVGNMKQKIDDGKSLRLSILVILQQVDELPFNVCGEILKTVIDYSLLHTQDDLSLAIEIVSRLIVRYYHAFEGLDKDWYNENVYSPLVNYRFAEPDAQRRISELLSKYKSFAVSKSI
ncbi:hypothetical protein KAFR_0C02410 [Kazachstania africana CBS 2517]|uniref:TATA-binding protein interacting (TIP20) domain-containing protein n=1 Tax=Kazachstania africana (strain ATCC 22294 / BCRC 22015 / CBS 2517 / CECT 1963 / NBRC 1671 / NRRL Y-8276) TaxID=1071382 RepID=H2AS84_KAZAF|nr:hypothetical protein KAFR_0C02410 [Kazachstania africana CBS 2517]CCF57234.1 hypothetical protein KAFR_0C02410 [Kazachstania africana CBS 2517]